MSASVRHVTASLAVLVIMAMPSLPIWSSTNSMPFSSHGLDLLVLDLRRGVVDVGLALAEQLEAVAGAGAVDGDVHAGVGLGEALGHRDRDGLHRGGAADDDRAGEVARAGLGIRCRSSAASPSAAVSSVAAVASSSSPQAAAKRAKGSSRASIDAQRRLRIKGVPPYRVVGRPRGTTRTVRRPGCGPAWLRWTAGERPGTGRRTRSAQPSSSAREAVEDHAIAVVAQEREPPPRDAPTGARRPRRPARTRRRPPRASTSSGPASCRP